ncbi:MAG: hypothetical protein OQK46_08080 [Gammaproteobacteria bacterium]|nr:hypothetical protein [Gammaproteobacteria bacterium]
MIKNIIVIAIVITFSGVVYANNLIRVYEGSDEYFVFPTSSIVTIEFQNDDQELHIYTKTAKAGKTPWKMSIENIPKQTAADLITKMFDSNRSEILNIKVDDIE